MGYLAYVVSGSVLFCCISVVVVALCSDVLVTSICALVALLLWSDSDSAN